MRTVILTQADIQRDNLSCMCIEPMLLSVRGKDLASKADVYNQLNEGQQALYMFYAFHNHIKSPAELYWYTAFFMNEIHGWNGLLQGIRYYPTPQLLSVLEQVEGIVTQKNKQADGSWTEATVLDVDKDQALSDSINKLYPNYLAAAHHTIQLMNQHIRDNIEQYAEIEEA